MMLRSLFTKVIPACPGHKSNNISSLYNITKKCSSYTGEEKSTAGIEKSLNQVTLLGRVGANPQIRGTEENPVCLFAVATNNVYYQEKDLKQQTEWHRVVVFKPRLQENIVKYVTKGSRVLVQGRLSYLERKDKTSETIIKNATVVAEDVTFFK